MSVFYHHFDVAIIDHLAPDTLKRLIKTTNMSVRHCSVKDYTTTIVLFASPVEGKFMKF